MKELIIFTVAVLTPCLCICQNLIGCEPEQYSSKYINLLETSDEIYLNGTKYFITKSPLAVFKGYDKLFSDPELEAKYRKISNYLTSIPEVGSSSYPLVQDKKYSALWKIVDNKLFLNDIKLAMIVDPAEETQKLFPNNEQYIAIERLTGGKFDTAHNASTAEPVAPQGVIPATWVNGKYLIKEFPEHWWKTSIKEWDNKYDVFEIVIKDGKIISIEKVKL